LNQKRYVLVTGATGFLGQHLVRFLLKQPDIHLIGVSKHGGQMRDVQINRVDLSSSKEVTAWRNGKPTFDTIFHLAAIIPASFDSAEAEQSFFDNLQITQNMLSIAISDRASFIYTSGTSIYGTNENVPLTESTLPRPDNTYSLAKYVGELLCDIAHERYGISTTVLRITAPYGPFQTTPTVINIFLKAALENHDLTLFGSGNRTQDFTYIDDVVQALWLSYKKQRTGVYNIAGGQPITMRDLAETVLSVVLGTQSKITYSDHLDPQEGYRGIFAIGKARDELGYEPRISLPEGLRACLAAMTYKNSET
jgi:nucleoside-diphosphate-sugar epimerase